MEKKRNLKIAHTCGCRCDDVRALQLKVDRYHDEWYAEAKRATAAEAKLKLAEEALDVIATSWPLGHECAAQERARIALAELRKA